VTSGQSFYITTPIYYPSDLPHIGHGYTTVAVDTLARWHRQAGDDTWMLTGTDEHGQKMLRAAAANGVTPQEWVDKLVTESWFPLLKTLDVANDDFIRTTQPRHEERVQQFVKALYDRGYIYAGEYEALYCVGCEEFKPEAEIVDGTGASRAQGLRDPLEAARAAAGEELLLQAQRVPGPPARALQDRARLRAPRVGAQRGRLVRALGAEGSVDLALGVRLGHHRAVGPVARHLRVGRCAAELRDRGRLRHRPRAVRATVAGLPRRRQGHPPLPRGDLARDAHGAGLDVPRGVFAHGWLLVGGEKMSKSKLTGIAPTEITDVFGSDAYRFYFLSAIAFGQDGSFSWEDLSARYQAELANGFGNLASRTTAMIEKYFEGIVPPAAAYTEGDSASRGSWRMPRWRRCGDGAVPSRRGDRGDLDDRRRAQRLHHRERPGRWRRTTRSAPAWARCSTRPPRAARARGAAEPRHAEATAKLWVALGHAGRLEDQPLREAGAWGVLVPAPRSTASPRCSPASSSEHSMTDPSNYVRQREKGARHLVPCVARAAAVAVYDNHAHLEIEDGEGMSLDEQLLRAGEVGVVGVVQAGGDIESSRWSAWAAASHPRVLAAVAIHPNEAPAYAEQGMLGEAIAVIDELAAQPRVRAIGETGLDFFRTEGDGRPAQFESFEAHIALAKKHGIAMQIHDRDAHDAVLETLERVGAPERTVFHCFSATTMARVAADRGYWLSFAGNVTFKNAQNLRDALAVTPRERILVETDAPFLTPAPFRGRPNAPYLIPVTVRFIAEELGMPLDELCAQLAANTLEVYGAFED
jgi:methionyl-tRNA synthetase